MRCNTGQAVVGIARLVSPRGKQSYHMFDNTPLAPGQVICQLGDTEHSLRTDNPTVGQFKPDFYRYYRLVPKDPVDIATGKVKVNPILQPRCTLPQEPFSLVVASRHSDPASGLSTSPSATVNVDAPLQPILELNLNTIHRAVVTLPDLEPFTATPCCDGAAVVVPARFLLM